MTAMIEPPDSNSDSDTRSHSKSHTTLKNQKLININPITNLKF